ncbi:hypothetical protein, partial [Aeromonas caviae]|uniref:hypothetical protein n=1 Tax=Aeromonas caviae TaxID=648 RepID=UPI00403915D5
RQSFDQGGPLHAEVAAHGRLGHATFERGDNGIQLLAALEGGMSKAAVCRNFGVKRTTLIETLTRAGWPASV